MGIGRSGCVIRLIFAINQKWDELKMSTKPFNISKSLIWQGYKNVKANKGSAGVDNQSLQDFDENVGRNLYKIWNRMASGSYMPPAVKAVPIPKKSGGTRILGIPCVSDRIAQMAVKLILDQTLEPLFHCDSYGYRANKSAHQAIAITRKRCWKYDWVVEFDIRGCFDNISHVLLEKALVKHIKCKWVLLYIRRWLKAPICDVDGRLVAREKGIPQGGVVSPVLMNLFLHYAFDPWMDRNIPGVPFCRYADDGLAHCASQRQAEMVLNSLKERFKQCGLELHPDKTKIVYCQDVNRTQKYHCITFDFLGYTFRPRSSREKYGRRFVNFLPGVSRTALKDMRQTIRSWKIQLKSDRSLEDISRMYRATLQGWLNYYGRFYGSAMRAVWGHFNRYLVRWVTRKFKKFRGHYRRAIYRLGKIARQWPYLFPHWKLGYKPAAG